MSLMTSSTRRSSAVLSHLLCVSKAELLDVVSIRVVAHTDLLVPVARYQQPVAGADLLQITDSVLAGIFINYT